jgi:PKD repeat protein
MEDTVVSDTPIAEAVRGKLSTWLKTLIGTVAGVLSGAFMMYLSPLLDRVVKPSRPVANFAVDHEGNTVTFVNHSSGGSEGWWDFGDGSPMEPLAFKQLSITHTYASAGNYVAKLTLRNLLGEESERTVNVQLESPRSDPPTITALEAVPVSAGAFAPATFRVTSKAINAKLCIWDYGDDRNLEISTESPNNQRRFVVFKKAGGYMIKMAAVNGEQAVEKSAIVYVDEPPAGSIAAILSVSDQGTRIEKEEIPVTITAAFPPQYSDSVYKFDRQVNGKQGFHITAARLEPVNDQGARGLELKVAPDGQSAHLTGELVQETSLFRRNGAPPNVVVRAILTQERRLSDMRQAIPVTGTLSVPGSALLALPPLPANWIDPQRQLRLELRDGDRVVWQESQLPRGGGVALDKGHYSLTATPLGNQVRVELTEEKAGTHPAAN